MPALRYANSVRALAACVLAFLFFGAVSFGQGTSRGNLEQVSQVGNSTREARDAATRAIPYGQLTQDASSKIRSIVEHSSYFRRLPTQMMDCDPEMFTFLARNPEVIVNIWDVMGITRVTLNRIAQYQHAGDDGAGTTCKLDLIFGNDSTHIYHVTGAYKGPLWAKELQGQSIVLLHHQPAAAASGSNHMTVMMDVFLKLENLGADLIVRTLGPLVNKSADQNFVECVAFVGQVSQVAVSNPTGMQNLASRLENVDPRIRDQFVATTKSIANKQNGGSAKPLAKQTPSDSHSVSQGLAVESVSNANSTRVPPPDAVFSSVGQSGRPVSTRRTQEGATLDEPMGDSPTLQLLNRGQAP